MRTLDKEGIPVADREGCLAEDTPAIVVEDSLLLAAALAEDTPATVVEEDTPLLVAALVTDMAEK